MNKNGISIIIVNYNSSKDIRKAIETFIKNEKKYYFEDSIEFIIVDNNSKIEDIKQLRLLRNFKNVNIIETGENGGFGKANNIGVKNSSYDNLLFFNADAYVIEPFLEKSIKELNKNDIGVLGLQLMNPDLSKQPSCGYFPSIQQYIMELTGLYKNKRLFKLTKPIAFNLLDTCEKMSVDYVSGACFFMKKHLFNKINGFDEEFFLYYEETDLCKRVKNLGYNIEVLNLNSVIHIGSSITGQFSEFKSKCFYESYIRFINKNYNNNKAINILMKNILRQKIILARIKREDYKVKYYKIGLEIIKNNLMKARSE